MQPVRTGNEVKYYVDARSAFEDITDAMDTATSSEHFIYMLNWFVDEDFELRADVPPSSGPGAQFSTLRLKWNQAAAKRVMIRAMFWDQQLNIANNQNDKEVATINGLGTGAAILDGRGNETILQNSPVPIPLLNLIPLHVGSQHQKILCILGEQGLVAFCGGLDFNPDRVLSPSPTKGSPLHDVHCRIRGPATLDLLQVFTQRWNDHPEGQKHNRPRPLGKGPLITMTAQPDPAGSQVVQIGRTFGDIGAAALGVAPYGFAPKGERTAREVLMRAIANAKRFLYVEDQYFVGNPELADVLKTALARPTFQHLTILLPHFKISDMPLVQQHRRSFIQGLIDAAPDNKKKIRVFFLRGDPGSSQADFEAGHAAHTYVHAKLWVVDDEFVSIGSVNSNRRSWSHDSEVVAGIHDTGSSITLRYRLAHKCRIELWQEHLNMLDSDGAAELSDGVAASAHWLAPPPGARIRPYDINEPGDFHIPIPLLGLPLELALYNPIIDPA